MVAAARLPELTPECLALLAAAQRRHPEAGFIHCEAVEPCESSTETVEYGIHVAFGSSLPYKVSVSSWMVALGHPKYHRRAQPCARLESASQGLSCCTQEGYL